LAKKFVIWTMQRSGGTSFARIIEALGTYSDVRHEPFNGNQTFGYILKGRPKQPDCADYYNECVKNLFRDNQHVCFKHCYEVHDDQLNTSLYKEALKHGYLNLMLTRKNNFARQVSLNFAKSTGAWNKSQFYEKCVNAGETMVLPELDIDTMIAHEKICRKKENRVRGLLEQGHSFIEIQYELLYSGDFEQRADQLDHVLSVLDVPLMDKNINRKKIVSMLMYEKQNNNDVYSAIPNFDKAQEAFSTLYEKV